MFFLFQGTTATASGVSKTRNIEQWDISSLTNCSNMWRVSSASWTSTPGSSATKLDNLDMDTFIIAWKNTVVAGSGPYNVNATNMFHSAYSPSATAQTAINTLNNTYNWNITW